MKAIVFLNGERYEGQIDCRGAYVVACDGGYRDAVARGVTPDLVLGDFDSLGFVPENALVYPVEKDATDGEIALEAIAERSKSLQITEVCLYNAGGGREDHLLGVISLLLFAKKRGLVLTIYTNYSKIYLRSGSFSSKCGKNRTVSLVPFSESVHIMRSEGLYYPLRELTLRQGETRGISNVTTQDVFSLEFDRGDLLVFEILQA